MSLPLALPDESIAMTKKLTQAELVRAESTPTGPVTCLGLTFANDAERRDYFTAQLREYLNDPTFRTIEGFPIGADEDILALSDPPYYTACPNPFLPQIMAEWQAERATRHANLGLSDETYHREPFAADVSEGKNDPIYNAHSYHTKVPHKAIMRYILHYTEPGDIVFDGFCGTGMTGVAAQLCGDRKTVESLGYQVAADGTIYDNGKALAHLGARKAVLNDLSPAATFIAYNYNTPVDVAAFERDAKRILQEVEDECGWMYETWHLNPNSTERIKCKLNYTIWSEVFICPVCSNELVFWNVALDEVKGEVKDKFSCPQCGAEHSKRDLPRATEMVYDRIFNHVATRAKHVPVRINYSFGKNRFNKEVDEFDRETIQRIEESDIPHWFPKEVMMFKDGAWGEQWRQGYHEYIKYTHQFFTLRNLWVLASLWSKIQDTRYAALQMALKFNFTANLRAVSKLASIAFSYYFNGGGGPINAGTKGTLYISSTIPEVQVTQSYSGRSDTLATLFRSQEFQNLLRRQTVVSCLSSTQLSTLPDQSVDYVFVDPPFGGNLMYSELNFLWESWLKVFTSNPLEAIISSVYNKNLTDYQSIMESCFHQFFRVLRDGRWITVEFHNSQNKVWNSIQEGLQRAGFIVGDIRIFDKKQGSFNQYTANRAVKQDLVISAYKPTTAFEQQFLSHAGTVTGVWDFVRQHLAQVPPVVVNSGVLETVAERQNYLLFDRMVAYHIQRGIAVPMGAAHFYAGLDQYFAKADGMYFLPDQIAQYDKARTELGVVAQLSLFVNDEKSAITWLRQQLQGEPQSFQQIQPRFLQELHQARHEDLPDLRLLLEQNFLQDDEGRWYVPDPDRAGDLEKLRLRGLLREFAQYKESKKKLRQFRTEAVRAGFSQAWHERDYATIVEVAERLPEQVLQEDPELLMYYDNASLRVG